jgi:uracil phosphoribosyltransferase
MPLTVARHAVIDEALARLRDRTTEPEEFRRVAKRVALILAAEATRELVTREGEVETPLETTRVMRLATRVVAVPILRAGLGMLEPFLEVVPEAEVGYFGLQRDEETALARRYYEKIPKALDAAEVFLLDPMLATGGSAVMAIDGLRGMGARAVQLLSIVAAPEGVAHVESACPGTRIWAAALDRELNERKFILPGLGDFGDRLYGT